jgi:hypothetical protein
MSEEASKAKEYKLDTLVKMLDDYPLWQAVIHVGTNMMLEAVVMRLASRNWETLYLVSPSSLLHHEKIKLMKDTGNASATTESDPPTMAYILIQLRTPIPSPIRRRDKTTRITFLPISDQFRSTPLSRVIRTQSSSCRSTQKWEWVAWGYCFVRSGCWGRCGDAEKHGMCLSIQGMSFQI